MSSINRLELDKAYSDWHVNFGVMVDESIERDAFEAGAEMQHKAEQARAEAAEAEAAALRKQLEQAQALIEQVRAEALERFEAVDKDHTMDVDTAAWLIEVAQRIEAYQFEHTAPLDWREEANP